MNRLKIAVGAALFGALALGGGANATVVTFTPSASADTNATGDGTTYTENGMTFVSSSSGGLYHWGTADYGTVYNADPAGATLFENTPGETITATAGASFTLNSFDLADAYNTGAASVIPFTYTDGGGVHSTTLTLDSTPGLQTFTFGYTGVTSFSLQQDYPYFQLDNVVFNAGVPEPAAWALMLVGVGLVGGAMRRRGGAVHAV